MLVFTEDITIIIEYKLFQKKVQNNHKLFKQIHV